MRSDKGVRKIVMLLTAALLMTWTVCPFAGETEPETAPIRTVVSEIDQFGNLKLEASASDILDSGFDYGDIASVKVNDTEYEMPVVSNYNDVDAGALLCRLVIKPDTQEDYSVLAVNMGNLVEWADLAIREDTEESPGFRWILKEGVPDPVTVVLTMKEKGGYDDQLKLHQLVRSDNREDYPDLDDAAYANFRETGTTGMGRHALYRSSSPVNPEINRNEEADAASAEAGIKTFINMADSEDSMRSYDGYEETYYSRQQIICLDMVLDFQSEDFEKEFVKGLTYMTKEEGPFLIHCTEGKDRAGFGCAILEALMGADADEIFQDYMESYYNFYGIEPGSRMYAKIIDANIRKELLAAFELETLDGEDLSRKAEEYLKRIGLTDDLIDRLREKLTKDY